ncbi:hypothetical protein [Methylobacterium fujisawaense]|uniref:hypothetical protein n=1 Tax=Methylobacterium fujisawaense TaxID=107400 RepID=UPI00313F27DF
MSAAAPAKSLKDQYRWSLWLAIAANALLLAYVLQGGPSPPDLAALIGRASGLLPVGFACLTTTVVNGLLSSTTKARLVFLRWRHPLPGCRAFSRLAPADPRIELDRLRRALGGKFPATPEAENAAWNRLLAAVKNEPNVLQSHRDFLLTRDLTGLAAIVLVVFGAIAAVFAPTSRAAGLYGLVLAAQYLLVRQAASNYGSRFVCTVMAARSSGPLRAARSKS